MELTKPTELAAFAAKQKRVERLDGLSKTETGGSLSRALAQVKVPSLKTFGSEPSDPPPSRGGGNGLSPVKPIKVLNELRTGQSPSSRKLIVGPSALFPMSPSISSEVDNKTADFDTQKGTSTAPSPPTVKSSRRSRVKPLASRDTNYQSKSDEATIGDDSVGNKQEKMTSQTANEVATNAGRPPTQDKVSQKVSVGIESKPQTTGDENDDDDFNFHDIDAEKEDASFSTQPVKETEGSPPSSTDTRPATVDVEGLYDCPPSASSESMRCQQESSFRQPRMFLPRASDIELFHVVLTEDVDRLAQFLEEISPQEMLDIIDTTERTLYHYAALSKDKQVQDMIFQHVNSYRDTHFKTELQVLAQRKKQMSAWMQGSQSNGMAWVPPRVKELQRETTKQKCADWASICSSVDENGRSLFHYIATTTSLVPVKDDYELCSILRTQPNLLSTKDHFKKLALHYAVEAGNLKQVKWYFQMGIMLSQVDVDLLLSFNVSRVMENVILRQLEAIDIQNYYLPRSKLDSAESDDHCDLGVSTFVLAKLQRMTDDSVGRLHQLPLHRAAMFGNIRAVELLLEEGRDPSARDANQWTPLHYCADEATANHFFIAQLLMDTPKSVDVNAKSLKGRSPLHIAVQSRKRKMVHHGDDPQAMEECYSKDRLSFVTYLHESKADLDLKDVSGATPLLLACRGGDMGVVKFLLSAGCDPTATGGNKWNALHFAAIRGNPSMVVLLLSWDADSRLWIDSPDIQGRKPADVAKNDSVRQMLANLWLSCYNGSVDQVRCLLLTRSKRRSRSLESVASVSEKDKTAQAERTPLHLTILGYMNALQLPETLKTRTSPRDEQLKQAKASELRRTAPSRFLQVAVLLLQAGADLCAPDKWGITPLMLAACVKDAILMETLLDRISDEDDLSKADADGNTALHYSYAFCQAQVSTLLEDQMDDADIENKQSRSPFEMTGYRDRIFPKEYKEFLRRQQDITSRHRSGT